MLNTPPPIPSNPTACSSKEAEPSSDIIVLDESSSSADSTPHNSPQKQAPSSNPIKPATTNHLAKKMEQILDSYHSKPHGFIQINDMILPYTNLTDKGYVVCDMYPKCIKYVCLKHLAECNIIRVDTYANKANLKNVFRSYQVASPEQTQALNEQVHKLAQLAALRPNNKFAASDRYDLVNLSELFAEHADKALYLQELELESMPERILTSYAEILSLTGGILQYTDPEKKKKHIQPFVDFEDGKYVCNLNMKKAIELYNAQLEAGIEMRARELEPALADRFNKLYQLLLFYMNIKYDIKSRKNKFVDVKDAVHKLPAKFRVLCSFTSRFPAEWVGNVLEFSARKNTPKKAAAAMQVPDSVSLSPNSMDSGSVSPNVQHQAKASFIEESINSIESDLSSKTSKICVISDIGSLITEKPTQVLSLSVINAENESNSASASQSETVKTSLGQNESEKENNGSSSLKPARKEESQNETKGFSDDVLHRQIELAAYLEVRRKIKLKRLEPNKSYLSRIAAMFSKARADVASDRGNTTNESDLPELDLDVNEPKQQKKQQQQQREEETTNNGESERQVPDNSINDEANVAVNVVFDLLDPASSLIRPCTSKSLEEDESNPIQSIQDVLNSCGLSEPAKTTKTKKERPKKRGAAAKGSSDSMSNHDTASVTSEVASTTGSLDSKLSKRSSASQKSKRKAKNKRPLRVTKKKKLNSSSNEHSFGLGDGRSGTESDEEYSYGEGEESDYGESSASFYHKVDSMTQQGASRHRAQQQQQVKKNVLGIESMRLKNDLYDTETFDEEFYLKKYRIKKCSVKLKRISPIAFEGLLKNEGEQETKNKKKSNMDRAETGSVKSSTSSSSSAKSGQRKKGAIRKTESVSDES
jgi:hypothetical protein